MSYRPFNPPSVLKSRAEYDACYYEITIDPSILKEWIPKKLHLQITSKIGKINAYVYGGKSRLNAT